MRSGSSSIISAGITVTSPLGATIISGSEFSFSPVMVMSPPDDFHLESIYDHLIIENWSRDDIFW